MERAKGKDEEINKAILEWLVTKNYSSSSEAFMKETGYKKEDSSKGNALEKRWGTILTLQKKVLDLENQLKILKEDLERQGNSSALGQSAGSKKDNENMNIPRAPAKQTIKGHRDAITCLIFHPIYNLLISGSDDASIIVWECEEFTKEKSVRAHSNKVLSLAFDPVGKYLASCSADLSLKIWNFDTLTCFKTLNGHEHTVSSIEFSLDGNFIFSASRDKTIKFWEVATGNCKKTFTGHTEWVRCLCLNAQGNMLASSSDDESIIVWNVESGAQLYTFAGHENKIESITFVNNQISVGNIYTSDYVGSFNKSLTGAEDNINNNINYGMGNGTTPTPIATPTPTTKLDNLIDLNKKLIDQSKLSKDTKINKEYIISASRDKTIKIWDVFASSCVYTLNGHDNWVRALSLHPNGKHLISCSDDKTIRVWELKTGRCVKKISDAHDKFVTCLAFSAKFMLMASGSNDQCIKIWECK